MTFRVEVDAIDAELLSVMKRANARGCLQWDSNLKDGVTLKVEIGHPIGTTVPTGVMDAVNKCIAECVAAYKVTG